MVRFMVNCDHRVTVPDDQEDAVRRIASPGVRAWAGSVGRQECRQVLKDLRSMSPFGPERHLLRDSKMSGIGGKAEMAGGRSKCR